MSEPEASLYGPFTTITVAEYNRISSVILQLRWKIQKARELLEQDRVREAKSLLMKTEEEQ